MLPKTAREISECLAKHGLAPLMRFGQNFLVRGEVVERMLEDAGDLQGALVLEIGPGLGCLTEALVQRGAEVVACEVDQGLARILRAEFQGHERFHLVEGDCLEDGTPLRPALMAALEERGARERGYRVLANLPYQITSPFLVALTRLQPQPLSVHLMLQLEVAEVLRAAPGSENYTPLSLLAAFAFDVRVVQRVPAVSFHPRPDVDSALVSLRPLPAELDLKDLLLFGRTLLLARRQALRRTLPRTLAQLGRPASAEALQRAFQTVQLTGQERAEVLQPAQIKALWRALR